MATLISIIQFIAGIAGCLAVVMSIVLFLHFRWPAAAMWGLKLFVSALSSVLMLVGIGTLIVGLTTNSIFIDVVGLCATIVYFVHFLCVTRSPADGFERVFGAEWKNQIRSEQKKYFKPDHCVPCAGKNSHLYGPDSVERQVRLEYSAVSF